LSVLGWPKFFVEKLFALRLTRVIDRPAVVLGSPTGQKVHVATELRPKPLGDVFTPTRPRMGRRALIGRLTEAERILSAMNDEAAHVVIYGERGRGKTSLTNLVVERLRRGDNTIALYVCNAGSNFDQIMRGLVGDLPSSLLGVDAATEAASGVRGCSMVLPGNEVLPPDIAAIPARVNGGRLIFVIDEFDRVQDPATRTKLADTIKLVSDRSLKLLFLIVGVSDTLDRIIGQHPSIQRNIFGLHLSLLDDSEIRALLAKGAAAAGIAFTDEVTDVVVGVARGMPYMVQLMGLRILQQTLARRASETSTADAKTAIEGLVNADTAEAAPRYAALVERFAAPGVTALRIAATAQQDRWGRCSVESLTPELRSLLVESKIYDVSSSAPGMLQPLDRPLIYHVLLLDALARLNQFSPRISVIGSKKDVAHGG
jgi:hypothetical protein